MSKLRPQFEYTKIPIHLALDFAEWLSKYEYIKHKWIKRKGKGAIQEEQDLWSSKHYKEQLNTNELFIQYMLLYHIKS